VYGNHNHNTQIQGAMPEYAAMHNSQPVVGRFFTADEESRRARVAVIGATVARELFNGQSPLGETIKLNHVAFQVVGLLPEKGATGWRDQDDLAIVPLSTAMRRLLGKNFVDNIEIEVESAASLDPVQDSVSALIRKRQRVPPSQDDPFTIRNMAEIQDALNATNRTMTLLLSSIAAISLVVGGIGIMNIMLVSVTERTREIGLRKAVGARRRDILGQFLVEAVVVSVTGGAIGVALGWGVTLLLSAVAGWSTSVSLGSVFLAAGFSAGVGVVFGFWPAQQASRLNPIQALRYE
jgi:macrolide transport system ATP-binding/permease protein